MAAQERSNKTHLRSTFRVHPELENAMRLVRKELKADRNGSATAFHRMLRAIVAKKPFSAIPLPAVAVPVALNAILLDLRKFESPITVCFADTVDEGTRKMFGIDADYFTANPHLHAVTYRLTDHSRVAIILSQYYRPAGQLFAKEIILRELAHALTARHCLLREHVGEFTPCTPPNLAQGYACGREAGYLFEEVTRGARMDTIGPNLCYVKPCSAKKPTTIIPLTAADLVTLETNPVTSLAQWPTDKRKRKSSKSTKKKPRKAIRDVMCVPVPTWI